MLNLINEPIGQRTLTCDLHGSFRSSGQRVGIGRAIREIWTSCPGCQAALSTNTHLDNAGRAAEFQSARLATLLQQSAIPRRFIGRSFDNYLIHSPEQSRALRACEVYAESFEQHLADGTGLVLAGTAGTGKSHLAAAILQAIMPEHVGAYTTMMDLIHLLREGWGGAKAGKGEVRVLAELGALPLLVIDEIGVQFGTAAEQVHLFEVLDRRYRNMRPTILITNQDDAGLQNYVGARVFDRLTETATWVDFSWASHRAEARKEMSA